MLIAAIVFFEINIFISLKIIIICYFLTALFGICVGVVAASVVLANGYFADMLAWGIPGVLFIFSGAFIPLRVLPRWMQYIANIMPTSSLYDFLRDFIKNDIFHWGLLGKSICVLLCWALFSSIIYKLALKIFKIRGRASILL